MLQEHTAECRQHNISSISNKPHLYSIQHCFDDAGDRRHVFLVLKVDAIQHHLVRPADEVGQALVDAVMTGRQRRTVGRGRELEELVEQSEGKGRRNSRKK